MYGIKFSSDSAIDCIFDSAFVVFLLSRDLRRALMAFSCFLPNESSILKRFCLASTSSANLFTPTRTLESSSTSFFNLYAFCLISAWKNPFSIALSAPPILSIFLRYFHVCSSISSHSSSK